MAGSARESRRPYRSGIPGDRAFSFQAGTCREEHPMWSAISRSLPQLEMSGNNLKVSGIINLPSLGSLSGGKLLCPEQYIEGFASVPVRIVENRPRVPLLNSIEPSIGWSHPLTKKGDACSLPTWQANLVEEPSNT